MKRPLAVIGITYLIVLCLAAQFDTAVCAVLAVLCAAGAVFLLAASGLFRRRAALFTVFCTAGAAFAVYAFTWHFAYYPTASLAGKTAEVQGVVTEAPVKSGTSYRYLVRADSVRINGKTVSSGITLRVKMTDGSVEPFSRVRFSAVLSLPPVASSDGFDSQQYYRAKGVYLFASADEVTTAAPTGFHPYALAIRLRQAVSSRLQNRVGGTWGALTAGILIGDISSLPSWVKDDFTVNGISHILAVSGTQVSLLMQAVLFLLLRAKVPRRLSLGLTAASVAGFMAVTGFSPSVNRAGLMAFLYLGGLMVRREADALNSLGASVLVLCLFNPFAATDTGLLLSFAATLGLVTVSGPTGRWLDAHPLAGAPRPVRMLGGVFSETFGATLLTAPVILLTFRQFSLVSFLSNLVEVPLSLLATLAAAVLSILPDGVIFAWLVHPLALLLRLCCGAMIGLAHVLAGLPFAAVSTDYAFVYVVLALAAAVAFLCWHLRGRGADVRLAAMCVLCALMLGIAVHEAAAKGVLEFDALPVENGSATVLLLGGHALVVDLAGSDSAYQVDTFLKQRRVSAVDMVILPAWSTSRGTELQELKGERTVKTVVLPAACREKAGMATQYIQKTGTLHWGGAAITVYPSKTDEKLLVSVRYGGSHVLLTGENAADCSSYSLSAQALKADALFYGGGLSSDLVKTVSPQDAVFSGSSTSETAEAGGLLGAMGCTVSDAENGTVCLRTRGGAFVRLS